MANRLGIRFDGFDTVGETIEIARLAEENGISGLWMTEHLGYREAMASCMAFLLATRNVTVVPAAVTPYLWHPMPTAMSLATMAEVAPGRVAVAVGIGNLLDLQRSGVEVRRPVEAVADFVAALRQLWTAKPVQMQGVTFDLDGSAMAFTPPAPIPVYVTALGLEVAGLAGQVADGVHLSAGLSVSFAARCVEAAEAAAKQAGRDPSTLHKAGFLYFSASNNGKDAIEDLRRKLAFLFRNRLMAENIAASGLPIDQEAIISAVAGGEMDTAAGLVSDDAVEAFAVGGTPRQCCDRLEAYRAAGIAEPVIQIGGTAEQKALAVQVVHEYLGA